jgi:hypothetical protein
LDEELLMIFWQLPDTQKYIAFEYVKQQLEIISKAKKRDIINSQNKSQTFKDM